MLVLTYIPLLFFALVTAKKSAKNTDAVKEKLTLMAAQNNGVIKLNDDTFDLLTSTDRDWSAVVQFTALKSTYKCEPCKQLDPILTTIGKAWNKVNAAERNQHFFASIDFDDGKETFRKLGLTQAPVVSIYPAANGPRSPSNGKIDALLFDFQSSGFDTGLIVEQLSRHTPVPIPYRAPPNYALIITTLVSLVSFAAVARFVLPFLLSRWTWAFITIGTMLVMTGGYMFVRIRGMPYVAGGSNGAIIIARGFQNQYGIEVQIIGFICECLLSPVEDFIFEWQFRWFAIVKFHFLDITSSTQRISIKTTLRGLRLARSKCHVILK
ncbi:hypothetical protein Clacol_006376 [Clathrus columnatus]|uniref:Uncharacterized protein n=1 Tax=Clathrus columnatus TaxID=1419009 RepID=A0AAV5ACQ2_9AGAM|nr:hypothetical protein Clacol_006376 [Clathrus columnatus]